MGFHLYQEVIKHSLASGAAYHVHAALALRAKDDLRQVRMSVAQLVEETRLKKRSVHGGLKALSDLKHITANRKGSKKGINQFVLHPLQPAFNACSLAAEVGTEPAPIAGSLLKNLHQVQVVGQQSAPGAPIREDYKEERADPASLPSADVGGRTVCSIDADQEKRDSADPEKRKTSPQSPPSQRRGRQGGQVGAWFNDLCAMWPNPDRADCDYAERVARKHEANGPRILAAAREKAKSDNWKEGNGKFVPTMSKFIDGGSWRNVPVILTVEDAKRVVEKALAGIDEGNWKFHQAQRLRQRFLEAHGVQDLQRCLAVVEAAKELARQRLVL